MAKELSFAFKYDGEAVSHMLKTLAKATAKMLTMKATASTACVMHAIHHGNATPMTQFITACGEGERNDAIVKWALEFGPFKWEHDKDLKTNVFRMDTAKAEVLREKGDDYIKILMATPYWKFVPQPEVKPFNMLDSIRNAIKRAEKAMNDEARKENSDFTGFDDFKALLAKFEPAKEAE